MAVCSSQLLTLGVSVNSLSNYIPCHMSKNEDSLRLPFKIYYRILHNSQLLINLSTSISSTSVKQRSAFHMNQGEFNSVPSFHFKLLQF